MNAKSNKTSQKTSIPKIAFYLRNRHETAFSRNVPIDVPVRLNHSIMKHIGLFSEVSQEVSEKPSDTYATVTIQYYYDQHRDYRMVFDLNLEKDISCRQLGVANVFLNELKDAFS